MTTRIRTIKYERHKGVRAPALVSCSNVAQPSLRVRGRAMIDIYPPQPKKRIRAKKFVRPPTIWDYCGGHHTAPFVVRVVALVLIVALNAFALSSVGTTAAYYLDGEVLKGNSYVAGSVDFVLQSTPYSLSATALGSSVGGVATRTVSVIPELGTNTFWYHASSTNFGADLDFCESLSLTSSLEGVQNYSGPLKGFTSPATTTLTSWQFDISTSNALHNKVCTFDFEYTGWQERHNVPGFTEMGYNDIEKEPNKIASQGLRLNKVYYDVFEGTTPSPCVASLGLLAESSTSSCNSIPPTSTSTSRGVEGLNEWVEVYNQTNVEQNITGWSICDNTSCDVIPRTAIIPPFGYALITGASSTLAFWNIPLSFPTAVLPDGTIGDGLDNDNDMLVLKRPDGMIVDQMNYGASPNIGWANYNADVWIPGALDVVEGGALARSPNGYDTDQPSDWVGFGVPTIILINPSSSSGGTWNFGAPHDIFWSATNPNGPNTDLLIDIYLIRDSDSTRTVTPADTVIPVILGTENDGHYYMEATSGFSGYFWVKVVATGSENPLLNDADYSGKFYGSSSCKTSGTKSSTSGCITTSSIDSGGSNNVANDKKQNDDSDDNEDDHLVVDKQQHGDEDHHKNEERADRIAKNSPQHSDESVDSEKEPLKKQGEGNNGEGEKEALHEHIAGHTSHVEEAPPSITVYRKEDEVPIVIEKNTPRNDKPEADLLVEPVPALVATGEVAVVSATVPE